VGHGCKKFDFEGNYLSDFIFGLSNSEGVEFLNDMKKYENGLSRIYKATLKK